MTLPTNVAVVASCLLTITAASTATAEEKTFDASRDRRLEISTIVDEYTMRLSMPNAVGVSIVAENPLMVSVEAAKDGASGFLLSLEERFLEQLDEDDLRAVIAHELGHVWIFTHHPFLQTEPLANKIAMRLVSRESLLRVYDKVWKHGGKKGDLSRFLE